MQVALTRALEFRSDIVFPMGTVGVAGVDCWISHHPFEPKGKEGILPLYTQPGRVVEFDVPPQWHESLRGKKISVALSLEYLRPVN